nr:hypothetical protein [uncultured Mediterranean phage uvMED]
MIDPKFKDMLTLANMGVTPDALTAFQNHKKRLQQNDDALKMRNTVLFGNTFANPGSQTNATFIPPKSGSMYDNMVSPDDINNTRRDMIRTQANIAMTNNPINPMFNRPDRPSGSALLNNVNANSAPLIFQNLNKQAVADNLEKTIGAVDKRENKLAKRKEGFDKLTKFGLALQGKDPSAMAMEKMMKLLDYKYKGSLIEGQGNKKKDRKETIDFARSAVVSDPTLDEAQRNLILSNDSAALEYAKRALKGKDPVDEIASYALTSTYSPSAFMYIKENLDKFQDETLKDILRKTSYNQYISSDQLKNSFNSLLQSQVNVADPELMRFIEANSRNGSYVSEGERNAFNVIEQRRIRSQLR